MRRRERAAAGTAGVIVFWGFFVRGGGRTGLQAASTAGTR